MSKKKTASGTKQSISQIEFEHLTKNVENSVIESLTKILKEAIASISHALSEGRFSEESGDAEGQGTSSEVEGRLGR